MRSWLLLLALLLGTLPSFSQAPASKSTCEVRGEVQRTLDGEPVSRAKVKIEAQRGDPEEPERSREATTGEDGRFEFRGLPCGRYSLRAERAGFLPTEFGKRGPDRSGAPLTLVAGQPLRPLTLRMLAAAAINGRVLDADGEPLSRIQVVALRTFRRQGKREQDPVSFSVTNDLGEYRLHTLAPARYYVRAGLSEYGGGFGWTLHFVEPQEAARPARQVNVPTYFPATTQLEQASPLDLKPSDEVRADIQLQRAAALAIRGRVIGGGKQTHVVVLSQDVETKTAQMKPDGTFEIVDLVPGQYVLMAVSDPSSDENEWTRMRRALQQVTLDAADLDDVTLSLEALGAFSLSGRVLSRDRSVDLSRLFIHAARESDTVQAGLRSYFGMQQPAFARVKRDGTFLLKSLSPGTYRLGVSGMGRGRRHWYVESSRLGSVDVLTSGFRITNANPTDALQIVLNDSVGTITGTVTDAQGQPLTGVSVIAAPAAALRKNGEYGRGTTDQNGRFILDSLRPGEYTVLAPDGPDWVTDFTDSEFLSRYEAHGKRVQVGERQTVNVQLSAFAIEPE